MTDDLLVKCMLGEATAEELRQFEHWVSLDNENRKYYDQFMHIWQESSRLSPSRAPNENEAWQRLQQRIARSNKTRMKVFRLFGLRAQSTAAILVLAVAVAFVVLMLNNNGNEIITLASGNKVLTDTLADGSIITLNKNSTLAYSKGLKGNKRPVTLNGEAFFNVSPDKKRPFIITTPEVTVLVTGTSFNVSSRKAITTVIVETGSVRVSNPKQMLRLIPGERVSLGKADTMAKKQSSGDLLYNYYRSKEFICNKTPLYELASRLSEAYNVHIVFENKAAANLPLTTNFYNQTIEGILDIVCGTFGLQWKRTGNTILIK